MNDVQSLERIARWMSERQVTVNRLAGSPEMRARRSPSPGPPPPSPSRPPPPSPSRPPPPPTVAPPSPSESTTDMPPTVEMTLDVGCTSGARRPRERLGALLPPPSSCLLLPRSTPDLSAGSDNDREPSPGSPSPNRQRRSVVLYAAHASRRSPVMLRHCGTPHHGRSQSVRSSTKRPNRLELPEFRTRVSSMPLEACRYNPRLIDDEEFYRLRSFSITAKGVINRGDSLRSRRSRSNTSVASSGANSRNSGGMVAGEGACLRDAVSAAGSWAGSSHSGGIEPEMVKYRVVILGATDVGKTALTTQFMTSEYMNAYDASLDDDFGEKSVSVLLDGEESEMIFIDHPSSEMSVENFISTYEPHAYVVVYSITDRNSYQQAEDILSYLWKGDYMRSKAIILVGNKTDLVRSRVVSTEEGKSLATSHDCKFIETSSGINHNVDELLVGTLSQIRLRLRRSALSDQCRPADKKQDKRKYKGSRTVSFRAKGLLNKIRQKDNKSKSCENLHVL